MQYDIIRVPMSRHLIIINRRKEHENTTARCWHILKVLKGTRPFIHFQLQLNILQTAILTEFNN